MQEFIEEIITDNLAAAVFRDATVPPGALR